MLPAIGQSTEAAGRNLSNLMQGVPAGNRPILGMGPGRVQPPRLPPPPATDPQAYPSPLRLDTAPQPLLPESLPRMRPTPLPWGARGFSKGGDTSAALEALRKWVTETTDWHDTPISKGPSKPGFRTKVFSAEHSDVKHPDVYGDRYTGQIEDRGDGNYSFRAFDRRSPFGKVLQGMTGSSEEEILNKLEEAVQGLPPPKIPQWILDNPKALEILKNGKNPVMKKAAGGKVGNLVKAISDALDHLYAGDTASARQSLQGISEPAVREAAQNLSIPGDRGRALAVKKLEAMVEQISDAEKVPGLKRGGRASKKKC